MLANQIAEFTTSRLSLRDQIYAQSNVVPFDNALVLLRERMESKKLVPKQRKVADTFASGRDRSTFISLPTSYGKNGDGVR